MLIRLALLFACVAPSAQADALFAWEIEAAFADRAFTYRLQDGGSGTLAFLDDGGLLAKTDDSYAETGTWRLNGRRLCITAQDLFDARENCGRVTPDADRYAMPNGLSLLPSSDTSYRDR
ncbi:MAG: hypothetical protein AAGP08_16055 [Pseudomonadota bacterium]